MRRHDARANYCLLLIIDLGVIDLTCERESEAGLLEKVSCCDRTQYGSKIDQSDVCKKKTWSACKMRERCKASGAIREATE